MSHLTELRATARAVASRLRGLAEGGSSAKEILAAAERDTSVRPVPVPAGDPLLDGGDAVYDPESRRIWYNHEVDPGLAAMHKAHEYAHLWLGHAGRSHCATQDLDPEAPEEPVPLGVHRVEGYGPKERRERDANVFARELLLPSDLVRDWFIGEGLSAPAIAERVGVPLGVVYHQLAYAVLLGDLPRVDDQPSPVVDGPTTEGEATGPSLLASLDSSQREAARIERGPLLVEAGPGTGKTRTLVARVLHLLEGRVDPRSILALTFSNKAAEEMRGRVARVAPEAAPLIWMGTFHAFGLELLRKYGTRIGISSDPPVLDPVDGMFLLERELVALGLEYYQYLPEPTLYLKDILTAISRAKDELASPGDYRRAAQTMRDNARDEKEALAAEKALEVARVYDVYQATLEREGALDFGDLIARTVALFADASTGVADDVRDTFRQVLVDEYQDVNRASAVLLSAIAGAGHGLWVVGDARQSIYRFRGAAPVNMARFAEDFPGARVLRLARNYRSQPAVVDAVSAFAAGMPALPGSPFVPWEKHRRAAGGAVQVEIAADAAAEGAGVAAEIARHVGRGVPYRHQAVLCRSHLNLARIAAHLEAARIPVLYLGDVFERPEVRDMLALLSLACHGDGRGLVRVARFPEYSIPLADVRATLRFATEQDVAFPEVLTRMAALAPEGSPVSVAGRPGLALLAAHLDKLSHGSEAWTMLSRYLLERSGYLRRLAADTSVAGQQRRLAIYQFLQFAYEQRRRRRPEERLFRDEDPKQSFLRFVRQLAMLGDDSQLRQVPEWATDIDAVRLMTVHGSKGLEFPVTFVPVLAAARFPATRKWNRCPVPPTLLGPDRDEAAEHEREEECLFFVAISRAQDVLCLSRALTYSDDGKASNASRLLSRLAPVLPRPPGSSEATWAGVAGGSGTMTDALPFDAPIPDTFSARALETYLRCPRRYLYEEILGLRGARDDSAYLEMHGCVYRVMRQLTTARAQGETVDAAAAAQQLDEAWRAKGPRDHPYEPLYRAAAETLVASAVEEAEHRHALETQIRPEWSIQLSQGTVSVTPDEVDIIQDGQRTVVVARRIRTGRPTASEAEKPLYGLYHAAAQGAYPGAVPRVEIAYLSTRTTEVVEMKPAAWATRLAKYDAAMAGIRARNLSATPDDHMCPRCPNYFICPMAEDGM